MGAFGGCIGPSVPLSSVPMNLTVAPRLAFLALTFAAPASFVAPVLSQDKPAPAANSTAAPTRTWDARSVEALKAVTAAEISPDGAFVAYVLSVPRIAGRDEDGVAWSELHVLDRVPTSGNTTARDRTFVGGKVNVSAVEWLPSGDEIAFLAKRDGDKQTSLYTISLSGGEARKRVELETAISAYSLSPDGKRAALVATPPDSADKKKWTEKGFKQSVFEEDTKRSRLWLAELSEGGAKPRMLDGDGSVHGVAWSPVDDRIAISVSLTPQVDDEYMQQRIRVVSAADGSVLARVENPGKMGAFSWSPDGSMLAMSTAADIHDPFAGRLAIVPATGGVPLQVLEPDYDGDVTAFAWQSPQALLYTASHGTASSFEKVAIDLGHGAGWRVLVSQGNGHVFGTFSLSRDGQHGGFVVQRPEHPPELYTMSHGDAMAERRTDSNPWTREYRFARQEVVVHKARDGVELQGILVRPLDEEANCSG